MRTQNYCVLGQERTLIDGSYFNGGLFIFDKYSAKRRKNVRRHVEFDDYFATLATILNCIRESYKEIEKNQTEKTISVSGKNLKRLKNLKEDLLYLQDNFVINRKKKK